MSPRPAGGGGVVLEEGAAHVLPPGHGAEAAVPRVVAIVPDGVERRRPKEGGEVGLGEEGAVARALDPEVGAVGVGRVAEGP